MRIAGEDMRRRSGAGATAGPETLDVNARTPRASQRLDEENESKQGDVFPDRGLIHPG